MRCPFVACVAAATTREARPLIRAAVHQRARVRMRLVGYRRRMERDEPDFEQQDSGVPVTPPDRNPDPPGPEHSVPEGAGGGSADDADGPVEHVRDQRASETRGDPDEEPKRSVAGGPAIPDRESGLSESNPA